MKHLTGRPYRAHFRNHLLHCYKQKTPNGVNLLNTALITCLQENQVLYTKMIAQNYQIQLRRSALFVEKQILAIPQKPRSGGLLNNTTNRKFLTELVC